MTDVILGRPENLKKSFGKLDVLKGISTGDPPGRGGLRHRPHRRRQVHLPPVPEPAGDARTRGRSSSRAQERHRAEGCPSARYRQSIGMVFQALQRLSQPDGARQRDAGPGAGEEDSQGSRRRRRPWPSCSRVGLGDKAGEHPRKLSGGREAAARHCSGRIAMTP